jgi:hypothetical protein
MAKGLGARRGGRDSLYGPDPAVFWPNVWRTAWETRWISFYVASLLMGLTIALGILNYFEVIPSTTVLFLLLSPACGYLSSIWLQAAKNCGSGMSALGTGCFTASRRQLAWSTLLFGGLYLVGAAQESLGALHIPLRAAYATLVMLALPRVILGGQSLQFAIGSSLRALRRRPKLVVAALATALALFAATEWIANWGFGLFTGLVVDTSFYTTNSALIPLLRSPVTIMVANVMLILLRIAAWMVAAPISFCLYWQFGPATNR